jgi:3-dehydroquinate dehydratase type I
MTQQSLQDVMHYSLHPREVRYCLPMVEPELATCRALIRRHSSRYQFFEIWIDYLPDSDLVDLVSTIAEFPDQIILVSRRLGLHAVQRTTEVTARLISQLASLPCFFDFDIQTQRELLGACVTEVSSSKLLLSMHNYQATPIIEELRNVEMAMAQYDPWCRKFATYCRSIEDALCLFNFQSSLLAENKKHIVLGMGHEGAVTRLLSSLWGNEMIFAPLLRDAATAPGQLTYSELEASFAALSSAYGDSNDRK